MGCFAGCLIAAAISASGASLSFAILLALPGIAAGTALLGRYYARNSVARSGADFAAVAVGSSGSQGIDDAPCSAQRRQGINIGSLDLDRGSR